MDIPQGTLDLMILTILARDPLHGYGVSQRLAALSRGEFQVNPGSLFPSLYRLEQDGKLKAEWRAPENKRRAKYYQLTTPGKGKLKAEWRPTENNRRAKYYQLTTAGKRQLEQDRERWQRATFAVTSVLEGA